MNRDDAFIGRLEDYLETFDGVTPLPDRVRDAIQAELPRTRQVRPARGTGRIVDMISRASSRARWGVAAAVVVAAVVLGAAVINNAGNTPAIGSAPATASPVPTPTPSPTATPVPPMALHLAPMEACRPGGTPDCIKPGTYRLSTAVWPVQVTLDVPAGWFQWQPSVDFEGLLVDGGPDARDGSGWGVMLANVGTVSMDPCDPAKGTLDPADTSTVDGLVTAMSTWPGFQATAPVPITVDGHAGQLIELTSTETWASCPDPVLWNTTRGWKVDAYPVLTEQSTRRAGQYRIVDVDGSLIVIRTTDFPDTSPFEESQGVAPDPTRHSADQVELRQILDSIRFIFISAP
jgi:hypothetical protein